MQTVKVEGNKRTNLSKSATSAARREGLVLCNLYNEGENVHFTTTKLGVRGLVYTPDFKKADLVVDGQHYEAIVKDIQFHPVTDEILHIDFLPLVSGRTFIAEIPIKLTGVAKGVKLGGKLQKLRRRVKVRTTPENLVSELSVDVTDLVLGKSIRVRDIEAPEGVHVMTASGTPVATIEIPRALRSAQMAAAGEAEEEEL